MAKGGGGLGTIIGLGIAGVGVWWLGGQFGWWGGTTAATIPTTPTTPTTTTTAGGIIPVGTPMPTTPAASVNLASAVTQLGSQFNNALQATFTINGANQSIAVIPNGDAYNNAGQDITAQLATVGVTPAQLYSLMSAAMPTATVPSGGTVAAPTTPSTGTLPLQPSTPVTTTPVTGSPIAVTPVTVRRPVRFPNRGMGAMVYANNRNYVYRRVV